MATREAVATWLESHVADVLGLTPAEIDRSASFESLGLGSRDAIVLSGDLEEWLGLSLPPTLLYEYTSIIAVAAHLSESERTDKDQLVLGREGALSSGAFWELVFDGELPGSEELAAYQTALDKLTEAGAKAAPLSSGQKRLWFLDQLEEDKAVYNLSSLAMRIKGPLDVAALERAIHFIASRHEPLRTRYATVGGRPVQLIDPKSLARLEVWDFRRAESAGALAEFLSRARRFVTRAFDLKRGPLVRPLLARFTDDDNIFLAPAHHIAMDGVSMSVFMRELRAAYEAYCRGEELELDPLPLDYSDYAHWQRSQLHGPAIQAHLAFWREKLAGAPPLYTLTSDRPRPSTQCFDGARHTIRLPEETTLALGSFARTRSVTLNAVLLALLNALLVRHTGGNDVIVGTPMAGRRGAAMEKIVGFFVNSVVLRTDLSGSPDILTAIRRTSETLKEAALHQDAPFDAVVEAIAPGRDMSHPPLFQIQFVHEPAPEGADCLGECSVEEWPLHTGKAKYDLTLFVRETDGSLQLTFEYAAALFERATIERFAQHYVRMIDAALSDGKIGIEDVDLTNDRERRAMDECNKTDVPKPFTSIVDQVYARAKETPEATAVICEVDLGDSRGRMTHADGSRGRMTHADGSRGRMTHILTYAELVARADAIAAVLSLEPADGERRVVICAKRSVDCVAGILGILRAGAAFVPIDPDAPDARIAELIADSGAKTVLVTKTTRARVDAPDARVVVIEDVAANSFPASVPIGASSAAYVIYTSGSTGKPKGVVVEHGNLANYAVGVTKRLALRRGYSFAMVTTFAADLGYTALFPTLCAGGVLHVVTKERAMSASALGEYVSRHGIDYMKIVPSHLRALLGSRTGDDVLPRACVVLGGEALTWDLADRVHRARPELRVINHYGPTETTVGCLTNEIDWAAPRFGATVPVGRPLGNVRAYVVDSKVRPAPLGLPGELCIAGAGVARGYLDRPDLTAAAFVDGPFGERVYKVNKVNRGQPPIFEGISGEWIAASTSKNRWLSPIYERVYKTGDRARQWPNGVIEFLGRADRQAKVRGYRVELGEIEAALRAVAGVADCVVLLEGSGGDTRINAYAVASDKYLSPADIRTRLRASLPEYMVPASVVLLDALPITPNGKLDTRALPTPSRDTSGAAVELSTPTERILAGLWGELLKTNVTSAEDNFLDLGGHSLLAIEM
ncbi:MAG: amino acid adenylation domain-containing protein, partial [Candidatus Hydrogenedentota bacterium]